MSHFFPAATIAFLVSFYANPGVAQTVTDIDGNVYNTISIGTQTWTRENLKTTRFSNGDEIPTTTSAVNNNWMSLYQWYYDDDTANINTYGRLYSWIAVYDERNVCPAGWRVPANSDWEKLALALGGDSIAGGKMKETGTAHWTSTDTSVTNSSGFTALAGGFRGNPSGFINMGSIGFFWSATPLDTGPFPRGYVRSLHADNNILHWSVAVANCGGSVRCVEGIPNGIGTLQSDFRVEIYPNPANHQITLSFPNVAQREVAIFDMTGRQLIQEVVYWNSNKMDVSVLPHGIYVIQIVESSRVYSKRFVKR